MFINPSAFDEFDVVGKIVIPVADFVSLQVGSNTVNE